ncbi:MAG: hypothetical protein WDN28_02680 [Chthoniobacter sp.]
MTIRLLLTLVLIGISSGMALAAAAGIVIYKDLPLTADAFADVAEFRDKEPFDTVTHFTLTDGSRLTLTKAQIVLIVSYSAFDSAPNILQESDLGKVNALVNELAATSQRYPHSEKYLAGYLRLLKREIEGFHGGQVKFEGRWFSTRKELDTLLAARKAEAARQEALEKQRVEALRVAEEKRRAQEAADLAAAEQARVKQAQMAEEADKKIHEVERQAEEARKIAEEKQLMAARLEAQRQEDERRQRELQIEEERREEELLRYVAERFKKVDRFRSDLTEPVFAR